jgi:hypothetical protein
VDRGDLVGPDHLIADGRVDKQAMEDVLPLRRKDPPDATDAYAVPRDHLGTPSQRQVGDSRSVFVHH